MRLSSFRGARNVVLVFYPLAFSAVCGGEMAALRDSFAGAAGAVLLAVSVDSVHALRAWSDAEGFKFALLSDFWPHGAVASRYGAFDADRGVATRATFIIDTSGTVRWTVTSPLQRPRNVSDYIQALAAL